MYFVLFYRRHGCLPSLFSVHIYDTVTTRIPTHGETYGVAHLWAPILDNPFLFSKVLTLDR